MIYAVASNKETIKKFLLSSFISDGNGRFSFQVAAKTYHGLDRMGERTPSLKQSLILDSIKKNPVLSFYQWQVSEIRFLLTENDERIVVSVVVSDVVFAVHAANAPQELPSMGFGLTEGRGFGLVKTVLEHPNAPSKWREINGFEVV